MRRVVALLTVVSLLLTASLAPRGAEAAIGSFTYAQICSGGKANVNMQWQGVDPAASEMWIDLSSNSSFSDILESRQLSGRPNNYVWNGLEAHSIFFVRVNQKLQSGDWEASQTLRLATACGTTPAHADATFVMRGFSDKVGPNNAAPAELATNGATLSSCKVERLYVFLRYNGLDDLTDFIATWTGPNLNRTFAWALPKGEGNAFFVIGAPAAGYPPGNYGFKFTSGGETNPTTHINANVNVTTTC